MKKIILALILLTFAGIYQIAAGQEIVVPDSLQIPGRIEGIDTHFEITNSEYLDVILDSSEPIKLRMESISGMVTMIIESVSSSAISTQIIMKGFNPLTTYYKYEDDYHNLTEFTTDENGNYTYIQDLAKSHFVFIQPRASTKFIKDDATGGDCYLIGNWDANTKNCILTADLNETIQIDSNNITLDGNSFTLSGFRGAYGIFGTFKRGITVKNFKIENFSFGIYFQYSNNNFFKNNTLINNPFGIGLERSHNNIADNNTITASPDYYRFAGIRLDISNSNALINNTIKNSPLGIHVATDSQSNILRNNVISNNGTGIEINRTIYGSGNIIENNIISDNYKGISLFYYSNNNIVKNNIISANRDTGMQIDYFSSNNQIYNNNFISNRSQAYAALNSPNNIFSLNKPIGGNYWSNFDESFEGCIDSNNDNFCDSPYVFAGGQDNLPWTKQDGWKIPVNQPPTLSNLGQFKSDGVTPISESGITTEDIVIFKATLNDPDNDQVKLRVELKEKDQSFNEQDLLGSGFVNSGGEAVVSRELLVDGQYKWRARAVDNQGNASAWQEFGTAGNVDFEVKLVPLYTQVRSPYPSDEDTLKWSGEKYADGKANCGLSIADCGCAITSLVIISRFHNITNAVDNKDINPLTINEWYQNNTGYWPDGGVKFEKILEYSKEQPLDAFGRLRYVGPIDYKDVDTLDSYINNLNPVLLYTQALTQQGNYTDHFIVADGKLATTYTIKDPAWYNTKYLNQDAGSYIQDYNNNFSGLRLFSPTIAGVDSISLNLASPAELLITDPQNRKLGKDSIANISYSEIPNALYYQEGMGNPFPETPTPTKESKFIWIPEPIDGQYNIQVIGIETGSYTLGTLVYDQNGNSKDITQEGNILPNTIQEFELNYFQKAANQTEFSRIVEIDIKPGSDPNSINCQNPKGIIPVAILTTEIFDAATVDADTVRFGPSGAQEIHRDKNGKAKQHLEDVDNDGDTDLVLHFRFGDTGIRCGDDKATLIGKTKEVFNITGSDSIRIIQGSNKQNIFTRFLNKLLGNIYEALFQ